MAICNTTTNGILLGGVVTGIEGLEILIIHID